MRSATSAAALLLALAAIFTECHTAQSERTRQRSGPIRSVPVGADVKRDKDFDCPEEFGYYPHPTDCSLYYVCVFGGALLESCTGGLMYSHELQTCDWPRNVGCDATNPANEELDRFNERDPPPPPPRRTPSPPPPPPPPRAQPNPVVTSRGQPQITITRDEYEKQQQLYEEIDDLPPVEEIENDRQQRVYRGQPSTIGQVQRDRDGYTQVNTGRTLNSNIIPASIPQTNSKIGSFSFGTQIDERRQQTVTPAPQTYSGDTIINGLDSTLDKPIDFDSNSIDNSETTHLRRKRDVTSSVTKSTTSTTEPTTVAKEMSDRKDFFSVLEDEDDLTEDGEEEDEEESEELDVDESSDVERGKRQIRNGKYYYNVDPGLKNHAKYWNNQKQQNSGEVRYFHNRAPQTFQNIRHHSNNGLNNHNSHESAKFPFQFPFDQFSSYELESQEPFKPSLRDPFAVKQHEPVNAATQIITKSPPISSLNHEGNSFTAFASGGFFNNNPKQTKQSTTEQNFYGSSRSPNTKTKSSNSESESNENNNRHKISPNHNYNNNDNQYQQTKQSENQHENDSNESDESISVETESSRKQNIGNYYDKYEHNDPYNFAKHKFKEVENPFAKPDFDFDAFLAKISGNYFTEIKTTTPKPEQISHSIYNSDSRSSTPSYKGMSTPRPFSVPTGEPVNLSSQSGKIQENVNNINRPIKFEEIIPKPPKFVQDQQQTVLNEQIYNKYLQFNAGRPLESIRPNLKPPNFKDERNLPLNLNFYQDTSAPKPNLYHGVPSSTPKPYYLVTATGKPLILSTPKQRLVIKPENILNHLAVTGNPYSFASIRPSDYYSYRPTTQRPLATVADHLSVLQNFWGNLSIKAPIYSTRRPVTTTELPKLENLFSLKPTGNRHASSTPKTPKRILIPKPSPEMSDYYYDDDEIYYEPPVKSQYMPSSEVRPQRPPMAQNYQEYDDSDEDSSEENEPPTPATRIPANHRPEHPANHNNAPSVSQTPFKATIKDGKLTVPVLVDYNTQSQNILKRPEIANYEINHHSHKNRTYLRRPVQESGPNTNKPPKYLNQTTLRPYTVRHRLAKPTTVLNTSPRPQTQETTKPSRGRTRHPNIVTEMRITTPKDSHKQETRYTKIRHDGRINSLEPTESVTPATYSANPKPKMLYNGSQTYNPDQYDPYYAVYDEDAELYKDSDFVQQYNSASLRPAVQQTYRGTPPPPPPQPARRPVETYTPRPQATVDYDDALIRGQISNQNQYQSTIRHSTRGEGNELGYDNTLSSVRTTQFEVISTTPIATRTSTTTQRPTVAPLTEAMTPSQYSQRSSSDESPGHNIDQTFDKNPSKTPLSLISVTEPSFINISSLAKPFEKTDNEHRLKETYPPIELSLTSSHSSKVPHTNTVSKVTESKENPNSISLTTGFSIRRNANNTNNPYTLTVISKPFDKFYKPKDEKKVIRLRPNKFNVNEENIHKKQYDIGVAGDSKSIRRYDVSSEVIADEESPAIYVRPTAKLKVVELENDLQNSLSSTSSSPKYFLKTVIKRPVPFSLNSNNNHGSKENVIDTDTLIEKALQNANSAKTSTSEQSPRWEEYDEHVNWNQPAISPYNSLNRQRNIYEENKRPVDTTTSSTSTVSQKALSSNRYEVTSTAKPSYYSYRLYDDFAATPTKEAFIPTAKNILKAFFNSVVSPTKSSITIPTTTTESSEEKVVNIGFQKKMLSFRDSKPYKSKDKRVEIITEPNIIPYLGTENSNDMASDFSTTTSLPPALPPTSTEYSFSTNSYIDPETTPSAVFNSKFSALMSSQPPTTQHSLKFPSIPTQNSKFYKVISESSRPDDIKNISDNVINIFDNTTPKVPQSTNTVPINDGSYDLENNNLYSTKTTAKTIELTTPTKKLSSPTRPTRVNSAIKLAVTNREGGRRSYQSSNKCSDNSLQENPKCNEIQNKRPTAAPTRGRGSAHYSTLDANAPAPQAPNRGTPPNRGSRPTLKPSTAFVSKATEFVDVYAYPPRRPSAVYPQPTPDKTAAKCRKDVCLLPDCSCGGKDIPGEMPVESVPQMVLLTFDDSVNDLNKGLYADLFEKGRVNPNGCPISSTFYVSHEWTDYSQVQNLYSAGHEMASHTISHSFGEQFSQKKWNREVAGQREILAAYGGVKLEDVRGMRAPFLSVGGNKMFKMLYDSNFTYDSSMPVYENKPPSWPYTLDYKLFHDCMIPPCPTKSYPGVWEVPMVMWQDLNGGRCSMGDACANPQNAEGVYKMILKNFDRHYTTNRAPFGLFYHAAWFTQPHHKEGFIMFLDFINRMDDVWIITNWQALQWVRDPTPINRLNNFQPFQCNYQDRPKKCNNPKVCNLWHKSGVRYMRTCQPCPEIYPWTGKTGIRSSRIDNDIEEN